MIRHFFVLRLFCVGSALSLIAGCAKSPPKRSEFPKILEASKYMTGGSDPDYLTETFLTPPEIGNTMKYIEYKGLKEFLREIVPAVFLAGRQSVNAKIELEHKREILDLRKKARAEKEAYADREVKARGLDIFKKGYEEGVAEAFKSVSKAEIESDGYRRGLQEGLRSLEQEKRSAHNLGYESGKRSFLNSFVFRKIDIALISGVNEMGWIAIRMSDGKYVILEPKEASNCGFIMAGEKVFIRYGDTKSILASGDLDTCELWTRGIGVSLPPGFARTFSSGP